MPRDTNDGRRCRQWLLLVAWILFLASMAAPAVGTNVVFVLTFLPLDHTPTAALLVAGAYFLVRIPWHPYPWVLMLGPIAFVLSIWISGVRGRPPGVLRRAFALALLLPWACPLLSSYVLSPSEWKQWGWDDVAWGYYLFAAAHTVAFIAIEIAPWQPRLDRRRGFPVVLDDKETDDLSGSTSEEPGKMGREIEGRL